MYLICDFIAAHTQESKPLRGALQVVAQGGSPRRILASWFVSTDPAPHLPWLHELSYRSRGAILMWKFCLYSFYDFDSIF